MLKTDEDALICDLAETYHIYDWRSFPIRFIATLACGLKSNSRIKTIMGVPENDTATLLLAVIADGINWLVWSKTEEAKHNQNKPESIYDKLIAAEEEETAAFNSADEFEAARAKILGG